MNYISVTDEQRQEMLRACGVSSVDELFADIPKDIAVPPDSAFWETDGMTEFETLAKCAELAAKNDSKLISFLGGGFYDHYIPAAIDAIASRSEFYTAYTPYQPELSQGTLQAIYEYQSQICRLTGMDISNASLYDGGTAIFEACKMALASSSRKKIIVDKGVKPTYRRMLRTHAANLNAQIIEIPVMSDGSSHREGVIGDIDEDTAAVVMQNPNFFGIIDDYSDIARKCKDAGAISIQCVNPIALALIKSPAEQDFDIAVGEGQPLGIPLSLGGPYLGFIGAKKELARKMPGRIAAKTEDVNGKPGFVLSLQAREQHIRREKATSNICSNEALCALRAHIYLSLLGKEGLIEVAALSHSKAVYLREKIRESIPSVKIPEQTFFNEFMIELPINATDCVELMAGYGFAAGIPVTEFYKGAIGNYLDGYDRADGFLLIAVTEKRTKKEMDAFVDNLRNIL